jgi:hypothetical protein
MAVSQRPFDPYQAGAEVYQAYRAGGRPAPQTTLSEMLGLPYNLPSCALTDSWQISDRKGNFNLNHRRYFNDLDFNQQRIPTENLRYHSPSGVIEPQEGNGYMSAGRHCPPPIAATTDFGVLHFRLHRSLSGPPSVLVRADPRNDVRQTDESASHRLPYTFGEYKFLPFKGEVGGPPIALQRGDRLD